MGKVEFSLAKEAASFRASRSNALKGPENRDSFVIEPDGYGWRLTARPLHGQHSVINGLTGGEANRMRQKYSDDGFIGKIVGVLV